AGFLFKPVAGLQGLYLTGRLEQIARLAHVDDHHCPQHRCPAGNPTSLKGWKQSINRSKCFSCLSLVMNTL
ncbi:hypothetical protein, partial [Pantoea ananatis]|uniref:hypothetical protein n=1 Tax=Pantoea ananas TaxID=553 RepID=UPI001B305E19